MRFIGGRSSARVNFVNQSLVAVGLASGVFLPSNNTRTLLTVSPGTAGRVTLAFGAGAVLDTGITIPPTGSPFTITPDMIGLSALQSSINAISNTAGNVAVEELTQI